MPSYCSCGSRVSRAGVCCGPCIKQREVPPTPSTVAGSETGAASEVEFASPSTHLGSQSPKRPAKKLRCVSRTESVAESLRQTACKGNAMHALRQASPWHRRHPDAPMIHRVLVNSSLDPGQVISSCRHWGETFDQTVWAFPSEARTLGDVLVASVALALTADEIRTYDSAACHHPLNAMELLQRLVVFRVLYAFGGVAVDPAVLRLWRPLPVIEGRLLVQEGAGSLSTSVVGLPPGCELAKVMAEERSEWLRAFARNSEFRVELFSERLAELAREQALSWMTCPETLFPTMPAFPLPCDSPFRIPEGWKPSYDAPFVGCWNSAGQPHPLQGAIAARIAHPRHCWGEAAKLLSKLNPGEPGALRLLNEHDLHAGIVARHLPWLSVRTNPGRAMGILATVWFQMEQDGRLANDKSAVTRELGTFLAIVDGCSDFIVRETFVADWLWRAVSSQANRANTSGSEVTASICRTCEALGLRSVPLIPGTVAGV